MSYDWMEETITMPDGRKVEAKVYGRNTRRDFEIIEYEPLSARWAGGDKLSEAELDEVMEADGEMVLVCDYLLQRTLDYGVLHLHEPDEDDVL